MKNLHFFLWGMCTLLSATIFGQIGLETEGALLIGDDTASLEEAGMIKFDGTDFLGYDGTDWLTFGATGAGSSLWSLNGSKIYYNDGNVGIGTMDPLSGLHLNTGYDMRLEDEASILWYKNMALQAYIEKTFTELRIVNQDTFGIIDVDAKAYVDLNAYNNQSNARLTEDAFEITVDQLAGGVLKINRSSGAEMAKIVAKEGVSVGASLTMRDNDENITAELDAEKLDYGRGAALILGEDTKDQQVFLGATEDSGNGAFLRMKNFNATPTIELDADVQDGSQAWFKNADDELAVSIDGGYSGQGGRITLYDENGAARVRFRANEDADEGAWLQLYDQDGSPTITADGDYENKGARLSLENENSNLAIQMRAREGNNDGSVIKMYNSSGNLGIELDSELGVGGDSRIITDELEIRGGSDLAENFDVSNEKDNDIQVKPGLLVSINPDKPGDLSITSDAYDHRVVGAISGANGVKPGMLMGQNGTLADGDYPVALTGRVYVYCDATYGPIEPGDLLTSSPTPGHAMKVKKYKKARGAIVGKAMTALDQGRGFVLVLVNLQ